MFLFAFNLAAKTITREKESRQVRPLLATELKLKHLNKNKHLKAFTWQNQNLSNKILFSQINLQSHEDN